jgi:Pyruvate/2-oxoacid:ferredoxin oxidoreductase delta subunit
MRFRMCEFCLKHGEGRKWYLQAKNYSEDLLSDLRRLKFLDTFANPEAVHRELVKADQAMGRVRKLPWFLRTLINRIVTRSMKNIHFGQVLPIEDVEQIFELTNSVVRVACVCREATLGQEKRYCYGVSLGPNGGKLLEIFRAVEEKYTGGVDDNRFEMLSKEQALEAFRAHEREGLCHTVWTFQTPFIGGICNCDRADCMALRGIFNHGTSLVFRAEYVAEVEEAKCNGCRQCMRLCQFGALGYSAATKKVVVDQQRCYGCGICRSLCGTGAIALKDRADSPVANVWG